MILPLILALVVAIPAAPVAAQAPATVFFPGGAQTSEHPFELNNDRIYVQATVGRTRGWFVLDSGTPRTLFDAEFARRAGLTPVGGQVAVERIAIDRFEFRPGQVGLVDLAERTAHEGRVQDGVLGADLFQAAVVEIDYDIKRIRFHHAEAYEAPAGTNEIPLEVHLGLPFAAVKLEPQGKDRFTARVLISTGSRASLLLNTPAVKERDLIDLAAMPQAMIDGTVHHVGRLESLGLSPVTVSKPVVVLSVVDSGPTSISGIDGTLGGGLLRRYRPTFDLPRKRLLLEPTVQTRKAFDFDLSGMYVTAGGRDLRTYEIRYVTPGSAADQAGFIIGDVITQVHRTQARRMTLQELRDMLSVPDDYLVLVVRRGAETLKLAIRLRPVV